MIVRAQQGNDYEAVRVRLRGGFGGRVGRRRTVVPVPPEVGLFEACGRREPHSHRKACRSHQAHSSSHCNPAHRDGEHWRSMWWAAGGCPVWGR